jgi:hypothetical protein
LVWSIIVFAVMVITLIGSLVGLLLNLKQFRRLDKRSRNFIIIMYLTVLLILILVTAELISNTLK